ncbi:unnamed protein product [Amaranthus hypochondriacus]
MESDKKIAASLPPQPPPSLPTSLNGANNAFPYGRPMHGRTTGPTRRSTRGQWTSEEDEILRKAVERFKGKNWKKIAECFKDRTDVQCLHRWQKVLNPELIKGPWSKQEDDIIVQMVEKYGPKKWSTIAQSLPGRIGKQCRERWHNHLNPSINKEAWTQEEELVLIRAHQIHGNRWAELTKYLPGRTDNAIKNHWNSSVKKKLDSYIASGLLAQFEGLPLVSHQSQSIHAASVLVQQSSEGGSVFKDTTEVESSECSQVGCSQTASDISNTACQTKEDFLLSEESDQGKLQNTSPTASISEQYYKPVEDMTFTIPDIPFEFSCSPKFLEDNFSGEPACADGTSAFGAISLPNIPSMDLGADSSTLPGNYFLADSMNDTVHGPSHRSIEYDAFASVDTMAINSDAPGPKQTAEEGCSEFLQDKDGNRCSLNLTNGSDIIDMCRYRDYITFQTIYQLCETSGNIASQFNNPLDTMMEASNFERFSCENDLLESKDCDQRNESLGVSDAQDIANVGETLVSAHNNSNSLCHDHVDVGFPEQIELKRQSKFVSVNTFGSETTYNQQTHCDVVERPVNTTREQGAGNLCYEPPRFPCLDIPFFSCDLAQSGNDAQQEFSPLGIRQLMMSSKLWDSPSSDDSPDAILKSAAKTFATPSILKKRHRDLLSPLSPFSERRFDKKTESNAKQRFLCTSRLTNEFSRLDVMFDETLEGKEPASPTNDQNNRASIENKENICPAFEGSREEEKHNHEELEDKTSEGDKKDMKATEKEGYLERHSEESVHEYCASETPKGVLVERPIIEMQFSSPDGAGPKGGSEAGDRTLDVHSLTNASKQATTSDSMIHKAKSFVNPSLVDCLVNEVGSENLNFFGSTPFRRSLESPSAFKSPWFFSSAVTCPRFDTDITVEDIGIFMSPGERGLDAIGLMKQINEQSADAYAEAREVLGNETPESILRARRFNSQNAESKSLGLHLASNVSISDFQAERRVLDFSECGTPAKAPEKGKTIATANSSSPSCLLKSYR